MMLAEMSLDIDVGEACLLESLRGTAAAGVARALAVRLGERACRVTTGGCAAAGGGTVT
jgi:hypothetical protein